MIVTTVVAHCDRLGCDTTYQLSPVDTQPFRTLTETGWSTPIEGDDIKTYCPEHARQQPEGQP